MKIGEQQADPSYRIVCDVNSVLDDLLTTGVDADFIIVRFFGIGLTERLNFKTQFYDNLWELSRCGNYPLALRWYIQLDMETASI